MGMIASLLSFTRAVLDGGAPVADVKVDPGGEALVTAHHYACPGDDSQPLPGDFVALVPSGGSGTEAAMGYLDAANAGQAAAGEKRIYSRNGDGAVVADVWLKANGDVIVTSSEGGVVVVVGADGIVRLGAAGAAKGVARIGDSVRVTIPSGTAVVNPDTGQTTSAVTIDGEITSASGTVTAAD